MPAPPGNQFYKLRAKSGRDKIFSTPEEFLKAAYEYFDACHEHPWKKQNVSAGAIVETETEKPYSIQGLCIFLGIDTHTFRNYEQLDSHKDFLPVFTHVRETIENNQFEGATVGAYNANIIARLLGLADHIKTTGSKSVVVVSDQKTADEIDRMKKEFEEE